MGFCAFMLTLLSARPNQPGGSYEQLREKGKGKPLTGKERRMVRREEARAARRTKMEGLLKKEMGGRVYSVAWSSDDSRVLVGDDSKKVTVLIVEDDACLSGLESLSHPSLSHIHALPPLTLFCGLSLGSGCSVLAHLVSHDSLLLDFVLCLRDQPAGAQKLAAHSMLQPGNDGKHALDLALDRRMPEVVQALLLFALQAAPPSVLNSRLCHSAVGRPFLSKLAGIYPSVFATAVQKASTANYGPNCKLGGMSRAPESLLEHDGMRLALAGSSSELGVQTLLWPDLEKGSSDLAEGSSTFVEVEFGQVTLSALAAPPVGGFSLFADLVEQMGSNEDLMLSETFRCVITYMWVAYGERLWFRMVYRFLFLLVCFVAGTYLLLLAPRDGTEPLITSALCDDIGASLGACLSLRAAAGAGLYSLAVGIAVLDFVREAKEAASAGLLDYLKSVKNLLDLAAAVLVILTGVVIGFQQSGRPLVVDAAQLAAATTLFLLVPFCDLARGHTRFSFLVDVLVNIFVDMKFFLVIVVFVTCNFMYTFMLLAAGEPGGEYGGFAGGFFTAWKFFLLGDFEPDTYSGSAATLTLFYFATLSFNLVITNAVIALMGDSWEKTQQRKALSAIRAKAYLIIDLHRTMSKAQLCDPALFPEYVHVIRRRTRDDADDNEEGEEALWQGGLDATRKHVDKAGKLIEAKIDAKIKELEDKTNAKLENIEKMIAALHSPADAAGAPPKSPASSTASKEEDMLAMIKSLAEKMDAQSQKMDAQSQKIEADFEAIKAQGGVSARGRSSLFKKAS